MRTKRRRHRSGLWEGVVEGGRRLPWKAAPRSPTPRRSPSRVALLPGDMAREGPTAHLLGFPLVSGSLGPRDRNGPSLSAIHSGSPAASLNWPRPRTLGETPGRAAGGPCACECVWTLPLHLGEGQKPAPAGGGPRVTVCVCSTGWSSPLPTPHSVASLCRRAGVSATQRCQGDSGKAGTPATTAFP